MKETLTARAAYHDTPGTEAGLRRHALSDCDRTLRVLTGCGGSETTPNIRSTGAASNCKITVSERRGPVNMALGVECSKKKRTVRSTQASLSARAAYYYTPGTESGLRRHTLLDSAMTLRVANDCGDPEPTPNIRSTGAAYVSRVTVRGRRAPVNMALGVGCSKKKRTVRSMEEKLAARAAYDRTPGTEAGLRRHALSDCDRTLRVLTGCGGSGATPNIRSTGAASNCKITVSERRGPVNSSLGLC